MVSVRIDLRSRNKIECYGEVWLNKIKLNVNILFSFRVYGILTISISDKLFYSMHISKTMFSYQHVQQCVFYLLS